MADLKFSIEFDTNGLPVIKNITGAVDTLKDRSAGASPHVEKLGGSLRTAGTAAVAMVGSFQSFGPATNIAVNAMQAMLFASGPVGLALAGLAVTVGVLSSRLGDAREKFRELAEKELQATQRATRALQFEQTVKSQLQILLAVDPALESINQKYRQLEEAGRAVGASEQALSAIQRAAAAERIKHGDEMAAARQKETDAIVEQIQKEAELARTRAQGLATSGAGALADFGNKFNVILPIQQKGVAKDLADQFTAGFNALKNDRGSQAALGQAFQSFVQQALATGAPDIGELLVNKLGSANFERLKSSLGTDLKAALDQSAQAGQQWGNTFDQELQSFGALAQGVGAELENINRRSQELFNSQIRAVRELESAIASIPAVTYKQVIIETFYAASPARPFSEFLPYMQKSLGSLDQMIKSATPDIIFNVPNFSSRLRQLNALEAKQQGLWWISQTHQGTSGSPDPRPFREGFARASDRLSPQIDDLRFALQADLFRASQAGGGAGGGGGVIVNIDLRGSAITPATLDDNIIPALERGIIRATGQDPKFRILN